MNKKTYLKIQSLESTKTQKYYKKNLHFYINISGRSSMASSPLSSQKIDYREIIDAVSLTNSQTSKISLDQNMLLDELQKRRPPQSLFESTINEHVDNNLKLFTPKKHSKSASVSSASKVSTLKQMPQPRQSNVLMGSIIASGFVHNSFKVHEILLRVRNMIANNKSAHQSSGTLNSLKRPDTGSVRKCVGERNNSHSYHNVTNITKRFGRRRIRSAKKSPKLLMNVDKITRKKHNKDAEQFNRVNDERNATNNNRVYTLDRTGRISHDIPDDEYHRSCRA